MLQLSSKELKRIFKTLLAFIGLMLAGTFGFKWVALDDPTLVDCFYMTAITFTTIGYTEVVDITHPAGRFFTIALSLSGIGLLTYMLSQITAYVVEGHLKLGLITKRIERMISKLEGHYIVCGYGRVGTTILEDLQSKNYDVVLIDADPDRINELRDRGFNVIQGDATDDAVLEKAGVTKATGLFATTGNDNVNLIITISSKIINSDLKIIARCEDPANKTKMRKSGADVVISPAKSGALRMFNEMIDPRITSFVDKLFFSQKSEMFVNTIMVGDVADMSISKIDWKELPQTLILAIQHEDNSKDNLTFNPSRNTPLKKGDALIAMSCEGEVEALERQLSGN
jgi:voltage-gated potassium channel